MRVISFYCGDPYYFKSADVLRSDCRRLGLDMHVVEAPLPADTPWIDACRYKIRFIDECARQFDDALLWLDVDCRLRQIPAPLVGSAADLGFFLRGFRDLRQFDPVALPRTLQPSVLYIGATARARRFAACMAELERASNEKATDDFFLQEAWKAFPEPMSTLLLSPELMAFDEDAAPSAAFVFGRSGNAGRFKGEAQQHDIELFSPLRRKALFLREAQEAAQRGDRGEERFFLEKAQRVDPADASLANRVATMASHEGRTEEAYTLLRRLPQEAGGTDHVARFRIDRALERGWGDSAERLVSQLLSEGSATDRDWAAGRSLRAGLERRAQALCIPRERRLALSWMERPLPGNFGDILNPYVVERLSGVPPRHAPLGEGTLAIGSTIKFARQGLAVWGTGTPRLTDRLDPSARYLAVRGPLTRQLILDSGGTCDPIYGDPAVFLPSLYRPKSVKRSYRLGLVLHHSHEGLLAGSVASDVKRIPILRAGYEGIERFIDELHECEAILSTSLHGLIVSHAYGIPARWCEVNGGEGSVPGDGTKFRDYFLSVGMDLELPLMLDANRVIDATWAGEAQRLPVHPIDLEALVAVAPFSIRRDWRMG